MPPCGNSFLSSVDLLNIYSLSLPGSLKISPSLLGTCLAWDRAGSEDGTAGQEELTATFPWGKEIKHLRGENSRLQTCLCFGHPLAAGNAAQVVSN